MSKRFAARFVDLVWPVAAVIVVVLVLAATATTGYELSLISMACTNLIILAGLNLIAGYGGQLALGQAAFVGAGAYATVIAVVDLKWNGGFALILAPVVSGLLAVIIGLPSLRLRGLYFAVATLAFGVIFSQFLLQGGALTGGPDGRGGLTALNLFGLVFQTPSLMFGLTAVVAAVALLIVRGITRTWYGWGLRAARVSEPAASGVGVSVFRSRLGAFILSGVFGGVGGALMAFQSMYVSPSSFTFSDSINFFMVLFLGGLGTFLGPVVGAVILYVFARWLTAFPDAEPFILGAVFLAALRFFPLGVGGYVDGLFRRIQRRRRSVRAQQIGPAEAERVEKVGAAS